MPAPTLGQSLDHLAHRLLDGEVVFFVGAGFSVDSEWLTAANIIKRLLLRLWAFDQIQPTTPLGKPGKIFTEFATLFGVNPDLAKIAESTRYAYAHPKELLKSQVDLLAFRYYEVNSALCAAFAQLLLTAPQTTCADLNKALDLAEKAARQLTEPTAASPSPIPGAWSGSLYQFQPIPTAWWDASRPASHSTPPDEAMRATLGKLLFIHATGLFDPAIMHGEGYDPRKKPPDLDVFARTYDGRLLPRHHILARFAREGLCPTCLTTNFDLLLEGAFRLAGFRSACTTAEPLVDCAVPCFDVIASPTEFFTRGKAFRTATVVKLHGCAARLRALNDAHGPSGVQDYLPQLVYTYREIQNWRDDTWAADYLKTLLRTRTFVLAGYSTADPVLHDTFRSVFEEMERKSGSPASRLSDHQAAPAYFLAFTPEDNAHGLEFHAHEVLAAASRAVGRTDPPTPHPNYLRFAKRGGTGERPTQDELLLWVQHGVLREQQARALAVELPALILRLCGRRAPPAELDLIRQRFDTLRADEAAAVANVLSPATTPTPPEIDRARRALHAATAWSYEFHPALRREWAHADASLRAPARHGPFTDLRHRHWYFPASERPAWTAWSAVLELALRTLAPGRVQASPADQPTVLIPNGPHASSPTVALTIELRTLSHRLSPRPTVPGVPARQVVWRMQEDQTPWAAAPAGAVPTGVVSPATPSPHYVRGVTTWRPLPPASELCDLVLGHTSATDFRNNHGLA